MTRRESLDQNEVALEALGPTTFETSANRFELPCSECGETYFTDEPTFEWFCNSVAFDASDGPFTCPECEAALEDESAAC